MAVSDQPVENGEETDELNNVVDTVTIETLFVETIGKS